MFLFNFFFLIFSFFFLHNKTIIAAPCCARNSATPALIIGDDKIQTNFSVITSDVLAESGKNGIPQWLSVDKRDHTKIFRTEGSFLVAPRLQIGFGVSLLQHSVSHLSQHIKNSSWGLGDTRLHSAYEILPYWSYSLWKPQIFIFTSATLPTGKSIFDNNLINTSQITGNGFYSFSIGTVITKRWLTWDLFLLPEFHFGLPRSSATYTIFFGSGISLGAGLGYSPQAGPLRIGLRIQPRIDQPRRRSSQPIPNGFLSVCDVGLDLSYLFKGNNTLTLLYSDQTIIGPASYSNLNRSLVFNFQHRWER